MEEKKRVALGLAFSGQNIGGVRRYLENIEKKSEFDISLFPNYECDNFWKKNYNMQVRHDFRKNEILSKKQQIIDTHDIFHSNVDPTFIKLCEEAQQHGKFWVHTYHSIYKDEAESDGKIKDWQKEINDIQFNIGRKADVKIAVGEWLVDELKELGIETQYVPNFIELEQLNKINKQNFVSKNNLEKFILFVSNDSFNKNYKEFIEVAKVCPLYNFVLIGTGLTKENIEKTNNIILPKNIFCLGQLKHQETLEAISACSIMIMTSFTEGLPTVLIEAMTFMKPCIIPNGPKWSKNLLNNGEGYKYEIGNIIDLKNKINNIMENYKLIPLAKQYVIDNFSSDIVIKKIDDLYKKDNVCNKIKKNILFSSLDNKFIEEIIESFTKENNVKIDLYHENNEEKRKELLEWADIIFCEWCELNALWYSKNKKCNQKLFIRLHRYELFTSFFYNINWNNVDNIIFIAPEIQILANKHMLQQKYLNENNFDWKFYLDNNPDLFLNNPNYNYDKEWAWSHWIKVGSKMDWRRPVIELAEIIDYTTICDEFKKFNGGNLIYNYVKSNMFKNIAKVEGYGYNLGIMGILPKIKRLDIALDIIEYLVKINNKYKLYVLGKNYKEWTGTSKNILECEYYEKLFERINNSQILRNNVIFESHTESPEIWFSKISYLLSVSDIEGSHQAIAEAMSTGTIPFIYGNALKQYKLDKIYPKKYCFYEDKIDNLCSTIINYNENEELKYQEKEYCKKFSYENFNLKLIYNKYKIFINKH